MAPDLRSREEAHVWRLSLPDPDTSLLSEDERVRAASYASAARAAAFVAARTGLRLVLAGYLGVPAAAVPLQAARHEKPVIAASPAPLRFNMAHRLDRMLITVARSAEVGVDLELGRSRDEVRALEHTVLSDGERRLLTRLGDAARHTAVLRQWVRREAVVKAAGAGLRIPPPTVPVGAPDRRAVARAVDVGGTTWKLWDLSPWPDAQGALATEPVVAAVRCFEWSDGPRAQ